MSALVRIIVGIMLDENKHCQVYIFKADFFFLSINKKLKRNLSWKLVGKTFSKSTEWKHGGTQTHL